MGCVCEQMAGGGAGLSPVCFGQLWLFQNLEHRELAALMESALRRKYDKGQSIFVQGDAADKMFLIKVGRVKLTKVTEEGQETTLDIRQAGDVLGENMFSEPEIYPVTAWCMEETLICGLGREEFEKLVLTYPNIGLQVIKNLSRRIDWLTSRVGTMGESNLENRLYRILLNFAREHGVRIPQGLAIHFPLTHEELSFLVGAHRVSVTRAMKDLRTSGRVVQEGRTLIIPREAPAPGV